MSDLLKKELKELAEYRASGLTPEQVRELAREKINKEVALETAEYDNTFLGFVNSKF